MLRFHKFTIGGAWLPEFGDPSKADDFPFIYAYSPLHQLHLVDGTEWPATLLLTADHDDRVVPAHTLKYIAQLYHLLKTERGSAGEQPAVMARVEVRAGHGAGKPTAKVVSLLHTTLSAGATCTRADWFEFRLRKALMSSVSCNGRWDWSGGPRGTNVEVPTIAPSNRGLLTKEQENFFNVG
jgi:prolyl oligopeptidase